MLKKMMKTVLACALVGGFATTAMAETAPSGTKIGGSVKAHYGLYTAGKADAIQASTTEANMNFVSKRGKFTAYVQQELKSIPLFYNNTRRAVSYQVADMLSLKIGTVNSGVPFSIVSGLKTHTVPGEFIGVYYSFAEADGLNIGLKLTDGIKAGVTLYSSDVLSNPFGAVGGSATQFGIGGAITKALKFRVNYTMSEFDASRTDSTTDKDASNSGYLLGFKFGLPAFGVSLDLQNKTLGEGKPKDNQALQVYAAIGSLGKVVLTYAMDSQEKVADNTWLNLGFQVPVEKGAGFQIVYTSHDKTVYQQSAVNENFIGGGFWAGF